MSTRNKGAVLCMVLGVALAVACVVAFPPASVVHAQQEGASKDAHAGHDHGPAVAPEVKKAVAVLSAASGSEVSGTVTFTQAENGVRVVAEVRGLDANGTHGFHVHEFGDCTAPDATSAGGHFNPTGAPHGGPTDDHRHVGDMGNLESDAQGVAKLDYIDPLIELNGPNSIIGHAVIVHEKADDLKSQPTGDAGGRIACGVVGVAKSDQ